MAVAMLVACVASDGAAARGAAPQIVLPIRASQLPDPDPGFSTTRRLTVHGPVGPPSRDYFGWLVARTQGRFGRAMGDFYPVRGSGLHLAAGTRFSPGYGPIDASPDTRIGFLYDIRKTTAGSGLRYGFDRFAPIALVGFDRRIAGGWLVGIDGGAMLGPAVSLYPFMDRPSGLPGPQNTVRDRINPVVDVTLAYGF